MDDFLEIYTDGAKRGKAGVGPDSLAAAAWYAPDLSDPVVKVLGHRSNNYAEYEALIMALQYVLTCTERRKVRVFTDSQLMQRQMTGVYRVTEGTELHEQWIKAFELSLELDYFEIVHIRGHAGIEGNDIADRACNDALDAAQRKG